jgi:TctA family transporter
MYRNKKTIEFGIIILFIITTVFIHFIVWAHIDYFSKSLSINKKDFWHLIIISFIRVFFVDLGLVYFYFRDKKRELKNN